MAIDAKIALLKAVARKEDVTLPDDVARYLAIKAPAAASRYLEGLVIKLVTYASLTGQDITVPLARIVLVNTFGDTVHSSDDKA